MPGQLTGSTEAAWHTRGSCSTTPQQDYDKNHHNNKDRTTQRCTARRPPCSNLPQLTYISRYIPQFTQFLFRLTHSPFLYTSPKAATDTPSIPFPLPNLHTSTPSDLAHCPHPPGLYPHLNISQQPTCNATSSSLTKTKPSPQVFKFYDHVFQSKRT